MPCFLWKLDWHHFHFRVYVLWLKHHTQQNILGTYVNGGKRDHLILIFVILNNLLFF